MRPESRDDAEEWLIRAERDLLIAARSLESSPQLREFTAFHAQQAAEKALKGFLAAHLIPFPKTHDLERLVKQCAFVDDEFLTLAQSAHVLSPYVAEFRYPEGPLEPDEQIARHALRLAGDVVAFVRSRLPTTPKQGDERE